MIRRWRKRREILRKMGALDVAYMLQQERLRVRHGVHIRFLQRQLRDLE